MHLSEEVTPTHGVAARGTQPVAGIDVVETVFLAQPIVIACFVSSRVMPLLWVSQLRARSSGMVCLSVGVFKQIPELRPLPPPVA